MRLCSVILGCRYTSPKIRRGVPGSCSDSKRRCRHLSVQSPGQNYRSGHLSISWMLAEPDHQIVPASPEAMGQYNWQGVVVGSEG